MGRIRTRYWTLYKPGGYARGIELVRTKEDRQMIFRQFLAPTTGCASYLFG